MFLDAFIEAQGAREIVEKYFPGLTPAKHSPVTLSATLNSLGAQGWELVHMEPVHAINKEFEVLYVNGGTGHLHWSHTYFCVLKRRTSGPAT